MVEMVRYVVLRAPAGGILEDSGTGVSNIAPEAAGEAVLSAENLPASAIWDLERDPLTLSSAPEMETRLIEPMASSPTNGADDWGTAAVGAHASQYDGRGVSVAILDTGIERHHPAFAETTLTEKDFTGTGDGDGHGHGTHCAGTVFGQDVDGRIGVARGVRKALIGKVLDRRGCGTAEMAYQGLMWAANQGANVISMSLGFNLPGLVAKREKDGWPPELAASDALESFGKNLRMFDAVMHLLRTYAACTDDRCWWLRQQAMRADASRRRGSELPRRCCCRGGSRIGRGPRRTGKASRWRIFPIACRSSADQELIFVRHGSAAEPDPSAGPAWLVPM